MLPGYIAKAVPNPSSNRAPWYKNTAPTYAGVFLWIVFYREIASGTLDRAGVGLSLLALLVAGLISYGLFYYVPATLGMKTGFPLYVVGSSTFGTTGGYLMPGILMGLLQVGWMSVNAFVATTFILTAFGSSAGPGSLTFGVIAAAWALGLGYVGVKGIQYVARFALYLNAVPLLMILVVFARNAGGAAGFGLAGAPPGLDGAVAGVGGDGGGVWARAARGKASSGRSRVSRRSSPAGATTPVWSSRRPRSRDGPAGPSSADRIGRLGRARSAAIAAYACDTFAFGFRETGL